MNSLLTRQMFNDAVNVGMAYAQTLIDTGQTGGRPDLVILAGVRNVLLQELPPGLVKEAERFSLGTTANGTIIHQDAIRSGEPWAYPFDDIAEGKFELSACTGLSTHDLHLPANRHLLKPGDILYPGSSTRNGIVVAASGFQSSYDRAVCEAILACIEASLEEAYLAQINGSGKTIVFSVAA